MLLSPLGAAYAAAARIHRSARTPWRAPVPVICIGNLVAGGAGKTPTAIAIGSRIASWRLDVAFLTRGYGGRRAGPLRVDPARDRADDVGDEPLLLASCAATWLARDRKAGAQAAIAEGADVIVMDDGMQNPSLAKDIVFIVIDGGYGFGNGHVMPAGPLREPIARGLARAAAVVLIGADECGVEARIGGLLPILRAHLVPDAAACTLKAKKVFAFAGIGRPAKFYRTLESLGARVVARRDFPDHHRYGADEAMRLVEAAHEAGAEPVTTTKDHVRLPEGARMMVRPVGVDLVFEDFASLDDLMRPVLERWAQPRRGDHG